MKKQYQIIWYSDSEDREKKVIKKSKLYKTYEGAEVEVDRKKEYENLPYNIQCSFT